MKPYTARHHTIVAVRARHGGVWRDRGPGYFFTDRIRLQWIFASITNKILVFFFTNYWFSSADSLNIIVLNLKVTKRRAITVNYTYTEAVRVTWDSVWILYSCYSEKLFLYRKSWIVALTTYRALKSIEVFENSLVYYHKLHSILLI